MGIASPTNLAIDQTIEEEEEPGQDADPKPTPNFKSSSTK